MEIRNLHLQSLSQLSSSPIIHFVFAIRKVRTPDSNITPFYPLWLEAEAYTKVTNHEGKGCWKLRGSTCSAFTVSKQTKAKMLRSSKHTFKSCFGNSYPSLNNMYSMCTSVSFGRGGRKPKETKYTASSKALSQASRT